MDISFIVCTRNRGDALALTLDALSVSILEVPSLSIEIVIVDNGSTDHTPWVIERWASTAPGKVIHVTESRPGLATARNRGVLSATGTILAFTDDDCRPAPGYLQDLTRHFIDDKLPTIRGGRVDLGDAADLPFTIKTDSEAIWLQPPIHPGAFVMGCNMVIHHNVFDTVGLFDERFGAGAAFIAAEETDLVYRAQMRGIPVQYVPDMAVRHYHGRRTAADVHRLNFGYHVGSGALYMKHRRNFQLLKHFFWDARKAVRELFGGPLFDAELGLSHRSSVLGNLKGAVLYLWLVAVPRLKQSPRHPSTARSLS